MVEQVIKYSDGTETIISYRGVIENGVLTLDVPEDGVAQPVEVGKTKTGLAKLFSKK